MDIRARPYPPNFSRIAANTIDPAIGASTWALGSQRCVENIGSLTKNPIKVMIQNIELVEKKLGSDNSEGMVIIMWFENKNIEQNMMSIGNEAVIVYIIKYMLACSRSG